MKAHVRLALAALAGVGVLDVLIWDSVRSRPLQTPRVPDGLESLSASACAACHPEQADEWRSSRMGSAFSSRSFQADWAEKGHLSICLACHAPFEAQQEEIVYGVWWPLPPQFVSRRNPAFDASLQAEGITCLACHATDSGAIATSREVHAPHATRVDPDLPARCARCHQTPEVLLHPLDRPMFDTLGEHARWQAATGASEGCLDCHLPPVVRASGRTGRRHTFRGGWDPQMLSRAVSLSEPAREGERWSVVVTNHAGHHFPTGESTGGAVVRMTGLDGAGAAVASEERWLARPILGPPFFDAGDTTLEGGESRTVTVELPASVQRVRAEVRLRRYAFAPHLRHLVPPSDLDAPVAASPAW